MSKYIVKNCPAFQWSKCNWEGAKHECCSKNNDCPIKQVVELCKKISEHAKWCNCPDYPEAPLANKILQTLQVEEVE